MCFLQIQSVQVCGIKRVIIQTTDFLQIKAYTVKKANVFSFALCGLIYNLVSFDFIFNLFSDISPQKVNITQCCKIRGSNQVFTIATTGCEQSSHLLVGVLLLIRTVGYEDSLKTKFKKSQECLLLIWLQNIARLWKYTSFHTLFPE